MTGTHRYFDSALFVCDICNQPKKGDPIIPKTYIGHWCQCPDKVEMEVMTVHDSSFKPNTTFAFNQDGMDIAITIDGYRQEFALSDFKRRLGFV